MMLTLASTDSDRQRKNNPLTKKKNNQKNLQKNNI